MVEWRLVWSIKIFPAVTCWLELSRAGVPSCWDPECAALKLNAVDAALPEAKNAISFVVFLRKSGLA